MRVGIDARKIADFGIGTYIRGLLTALVELGGDEYVAFAPADASLPRGVEHVVVDAPHYSVRELFAVGRAADRARLDVFHAPHYVVPFTHVPVVVTIHDLIHLHRRNPLQRMYAKTMIGRAVRKARRVLTVSESVARELACDAVVTPNGIDGVFFEAGGGQRAAGRHFLYVGNDKPHKNVAALVHAFNRAFARVPDVKLVLVGGSFDRFRGREHIDVRGFVPTSELVSLYQHAIALVMPSIEEGFGLPAAEAMACGTPVITSHAAALVEITGDAALHVRDDELADAMLRVARDESLRASMIARGLERARFFTWKRCATLTRDAYRAV
jgi:glycosyltransferase involved in cell wall biosynthesis